MAPPWATDVIDRLTNIERTMENIEIKMENIEIKMANSLAIFDDDAVVPPKRGNAEPLEDFPSTIGQLKSITANDINNVETYYGLSHQGLIADRRKRLAKAYGTRLASSTTVTTFV